jgi:hypothetical protein
MSATLVFPHISQHMWAVYREGQPRAMLVGIYPSRKEAMLVKRLAQSSEPRRVVPGQWPRRYIVVQYTRPWLRGFGRKRR